MDGDGLMRGRGGATAAGQGGSARVEEMAAWNRELDRLMFEDGQGPPMRWWEPGETAARARERIRELSRLTGRRVLWVRLDLDRLSVEGVEL